MVKPSLCVLATAALLSGGCVTFSPAPLYSHGSMASFTTTKDGQPDNYSHENPVPATVQSVAAGRLTYQEYCAECHGPERRGDGPALDELDGAQPADLTRAAKIRTEGELYGLIAYGRPGMPQWRQVLKESDLWNLVNYLRSAKRP